MKRIIISAASILSLLVVSVCLGAEFKAEQPILISSAGQSADVLMVKILIQKAGLEFTYDKLAGVDALEGNRSLILVTGGSAKGLGAANIDKDEEIARLNSLIGAAKEKELILIVMHVGGQARRGKLSDEFNSLTASFADCLIIVKAGDEDGFFSDIAGEKKIPIFLIDKILDAGDILKGIYSTEE